MTIIGITSTYTAESYLALIVIIHYKTKIKQLDQYFSNLAASFDS